MNEGEETMESEVEDDDPDVHPDTLLAIKDIELTDAEKLRNSMVDDPISYFSEEEIFSVANDDYIMNASPSPLKTEKPDRIRKDEVLAKIEEKGFQS